MKPFNVFPHDSKFDFMRLRKLALVVVVTLLVVAISSIALKGFNFALDFTGGTATELRFEQPVDVSAVRERLDAAGYPGAQVQTFGSGDELLVRLQPKSGAAEKAGASSSVAADVRNAVSTPDNPGTVVKSSFVGPQVGKNLAINGVWAFLFVIIGFLVYISFRFEKKFALSAVACTINDLIIVFGWFALTGREFDLTVLAGVLSVMGYSVNDTIVVFDRARENFRSMRADPATILNVSINQTLSRTVITSFVALLTVVALYLYGGGSLKSMAEALIVGIVIGTVSTMFLACPLLLWLGLNKQDLMPKAKDVEALARRP